MRVVVQRVKEGSVAVEGRHVSTIGRGFIILLGIRKGDSREAAEFLADKCAFLRVFNDADGKMNLNLKDVGGSVLVVSQFTLYADAQRGNRPGFGDAAGSDEAEPLYRIFVVRLKSHLGEDRVQTGVFGAMMDVSFVNEGPVTIIIESK